MSSERPLVVRGGSRGRQGIPGFASLARAAADFRVTTGNVVDVGELVKARHRARRENRRLVLIKGDGSIARILAVAGVKDTIEAEGAPQQQVVSACVWPAGSPPGRPASKRWDEYEVERLATRRA